MSDISIPGPFTPDWESLKGYRVPDWYQDGKFGIFIHWGVYSVPAFGNEWYPRNMYLIGTPEYEHHIATYGPHTEFGYKDFIPQLTAANYDPAAWARLFKEAGARFVVPVAEHHDGFAMYDTALSEWCAAKMGPKRDVLGELAAAVRAEGLVFGVSNHRIEHWWFFSGGRQFPSDVQDPRYAGLYGPARQSHERLSREFMDDWLARLVELIDKYQPQLIWFDWWIEQKALEPYLKRFAAYYYNRGYEWGKGVAINHKFEAFPPGTAVFDIERGQLASIPPFFWQNDTSVSKNSWGYIHDHDYKTATDLIGDLVDVVSKNGALLLNIGPRPDGTIPEPEQELLREIGRWLAVNGEAIYGTRPWVVFGEGPTEVAEGEFTDTKRSAFTNRDFRFTTKGDTLYAICLARPDRQVTIRSLGSSSPAGAGRIRAISLLGGGALEWSQDESGLTITLPDELPGAHAFTFKIALAPAA
ncbi:MAG: alpha-L-fucosidase [Chloroflexota bacterium]|nr:MAG: alpha-L-fucosidase [Chloroflexota bacterium]